MNSGRIRVGIIGVHPDKGWASTAHVPALLQLPEFEIRAISNTGAGVARAAADKFGIAHSHESNHALVTDPEVDLVVVTVKVTQHHELVGQAIQAGKAVFSEWPLGVDLAEAESLRDLAAKANVPTAIGLQTRASPVFAHVRNLVRDGYIGTLLSASMIGSGIVWGEVMSEGFEYTLDPANGAAMLEVPLAHSLDGLLHALGEGLQSTRATLSNSRRSVRMLESGRVVPLAVPDQIQLAAILDSGAALSVHFRGGLSRGTNFHVEINGTEGDLIVRSPVGYVGVGGTTLLGARLEETLHELPVPAELDLHAGLGMPAQSIAIQYSRIASDLQRRSKSAPDFDDAVRLHGWIADIRANGVVSRRS